MKHSTGNHVANFDTDDPYFDDDHKGVINLKRCDFCGEMENEFEINFDVKDGKNTGVVYCDDCKEVYLQETKEHKNDDQANDPLANFGKFTDKLCNNE